MKNDLAMIDEHENPLAHTSSSDNMDDYFTADESLSEASLSIDARDRQDPLGVPCPTENVPLVPHKDLQVDSQLAVQPATEETGSREAGAIKLESITTREWCNKERHSSEC